MDNVTRHQRIARRFLVSVLQQYGREAPDVLRAWADELEGLGEEVGEEMGEELPEFDLDGIFFQSK